MLRAMTGHPLENEFRTRRDQLYGILDPENRDSTFLKFHLEWFRILKLDRPFYQAVAERPIVQAGVRRVVIAPAFSRRLEGGELFVSRPGEEVSESERRSVGIQILPQTLLDRKRLLRFLRRELLHISDMIDPGFGYSPKPPRTSGGPTHNQLILDRYRVLWDVSVDGRLVSSGMIEPGIREDRFGDFHRAFPMLGQRGERVFDRIFRDPSPTHRFLIGLALRPDGEISKSQVISCPLCRFPFQPAGDGSENLPVSVVGEIRQDFPNWEPGTDPCPQCVELYRSRPISRKAERLLPHPVD